MRYRHLYFTNSGMAQIKYTLQLSVRPDKGGCKITKVNFNSVSSVTKTEKTNVTQL